MGDPISFPEQEGLLASRSGSPRRVTATCEDPGDELRPGQRVSAKAGTYVYTVIVDRDSLSG